VSYCFTRVPRGVPQCSTLEPLLFFVVCKLHIKCFARRTC